MSAATLANGLASLTPTQVEADAITGLVNAWKAYFAQCTPAYTPLPAAESAMAAALAGISVTTPPAAALKIQAGIVAFWGGLASGFAAAFPGAIALVPPATISTIAAALPAVFAANTSGSLAIADAAQAIAAVIHPLNLGGTVTFPPAVVTPIT